MPEKVRQTQLAIWSLASSALFPRTTFRVLVTKTPPVALTTPQRGLLRSLLVFRHFLSHQRSVCLFLLNALQLRFYFQALAAKSLAMYVPCSLSSQPAPWKLLRAHPMNCSCLEWLRQVIMHELEPVELHLLVPTFKLL